MCGVTEHPAGSRVVFPYFSVDLCLGPQRRDSGCGGPMPGAEMGAVCCQEAVVSRKLWNCLMPGNPFLQGLVCDFECVISPKGLKMAWPFLFAVPGAPLLSWWM